jgi:hypothetical protein
MPTRVVTCHNTSRAISSSGVVLFVWTSALEEMNSGYEIRGLHRCVQVSV